MLHYMPRFDLEVKAQPVCRQEEGTRISMMRDNRMAHHPAPCPTATTPRAGRVAHLFRSANYSLFCFRASSRSASWTNAATLASSVLALFCCVVRPHYPGRHHRIVQIGTGLRCSHRRNAPSLASMMEKLRAPPPEPRPAATQTQAEALDEAAESKTAATTSEIRVRCIYASPLGAHDR